MYPIASLLLFLTTARSVIVSVLAKLDVLLISMITSRLWHSLQRNMLARQPINRNKATQIAIITIGRGIDAKKLVFDGCAGSSDDS
jgi:hypothetical protein